MKLKKSLGQNFFNNETLAKKIVNIVFSVSQEQIIEIGPGDGFFTKMFHDIYKGITVIEKDDNLAQTLALKYKGIKVLNKDVLDINLDEFKGTSKTVVFGSLPYNISKQIIRKFISSKLFNDYFFIIQKEVAQKYIESKKSSIQYLTTKYYVDTKTIFDLHPGSFTPPPKVQSSFVHMKKNDNFQLADEKTFLKLSREAFKNPRKTLRNNLKNLGVDLSAEIFNRRPEDLNFEQFCNLANTLKML